MHGWKGHKYEEKGMDTNMKRRDRPTSTVAPITSDFADAFFFLGIVNQVVTSYQYFCTRDECESTGQKPAKPNSWEAVRSTMSNVGWGE